MKTIKHITLNSNNVRESTADEVDKSLYFSMNRLLNEMKREKTEIFKGGYTAKATLVNGGALVTVYGPKPKSLPILTTGIVYSENSGIWEALHEHSSTPLLTNAKIEPKPPYIADRLELGAAFHMDALRWTGDFSKCIGWLIASPRNELS